MRKTMNELHDLLRAKIDCIWIQSFEEKEVLNDIKHILNSDAHFSNMQLLLWSHTEGVTQLAKNSFTKDGQPDLKLREFPALFSKMRAEQNTENGKQNLWVLRDFHQVIGDNKCQRYIRDLKEYRSRNYNPIVVISPALDIPSDIAHLFRVISYGLPEEKEIAFLVGQTNKKLQQASAKNPNKGIKPLDEEELKIVERACSGLTVKEMDMALKECATKYRTLDPEFLAKNKIETVKKTGVLDYKIPRMTLDDIGGNQAIKDWLYESVNAFDDKAIEFGIDKPKGAMLVGIPGCGKTAIAEAFAGMMHMPLLSLSMSKILDRMVGQSERKIEHALQVVKACAPCVFLCDECEKLLGGISSSNNSDSGVTARVFQSILEFMNDNDSGVYVIMTSNDVSQLPPELTRSGRLDAIWYFGLPTREERRSIFRIHFDKKKKEITDILLNEAVKDSEMFTGAEIQQAVKNCLRHAYSRYLKDDNANITTDDVAEGCHEVIPVARSSREKIAALDNYCRSRARLASYESEEDKDMKKRVNDGFDFD